MGKLEDEMTLLLENSENSTWENDAAFGRTEQLKRAILMLATTIDEINKE